MRGVFGIIVVAWLLAGCTRNSGDAAREERSAQAAQARAGIVTISGDDAISESLTWRPPVVEIPPDGFDDARKRAEAALEAGKLSDDAESAIPLLLALSKQAPDDRQVRDDLGRALRAVIARGDAALARADDT